MEAYLSIWFFMGDTSVFLAFVAALTVFASRQNSMYYIVCFQICVLMRYTMRMFFRDPRPYMEDYQVSPYKCDNSYGNPSAAVMNLTTFTLVLILNPTGGI